MEWGLPLYACWSFGVCAIWCVESAIELLSWSSSSSSRPHGGGRVSSSNDPSPSHQSSHNAKTDHPRQQRGKYLCELFGHVIMLLVAIYFTVSSLILLRTLQTVKLDDMKANKWEVIISFVFYLLAVAYNAATWWCGWSNQETDERGEENDDDANKEGAASYQSSYQLV
jgi:hypothetical protein